MNKMEEPVEITTQPPTIRVLRTLTAFDNHLNDMQTAFFTARDQLIALISKEPDVVNNFVNVVVKSIQAVSAIKIDMIPTERTELIKTLVMEVVNALAIPEEDKKRLREQMFPMITSMIQTFESASEGYYYFLHKVKEIGEKAGCFKSKHANKRKRDIKRRQSLSIDVRKGSTLTRITPEIDVDALVSDILVTLSSVVRINQLTLTTLMPIGTTVMQIVEQYPQLNGPTKKDVAIRVLHKLVDGLEASETVKQTLIGAIDAILPHAIDFIISASKGEIQLVNILTEELKGCIGKC